ncbi:ATP-dependent DNA helicase RecQ [gut metagenome]|uniref:DNA 3'-5' helicase n=1 Tax=gut metagenome TaxID=749906 RepID=J9GMU9_9ZZZZ
MVVQQAEHAFHGLKEEVNNILLTSPTGAGKSLLFQLSAIYLAEKYGLLTIVVSPLVALMNDQVEGLHGYAGAAALNSNKTATEKEMILQGVQNGSINILYLAPELLLSYSITTFLGNRQLGLLVVDEAHTVTTWGRDFRVDYWFLGDYLRKSKRYLPNTFPIFALTATAVWDPTGHNDMVFDTIRSLNMDPCIKFIGVVRRENISFEIELSHISKNYEEERRKKTIQRIREALLQNRKTIVYFPFRRTVNSIVYSDDISDIQNRITSYHAALNPEEKKSMPRILGMAVNP